MRSLVPAGLLAVALGLMSASPAQSQTTGSINGTVTDNTGAVLPGGFSNVVRDGIVVNIGFAATVNVQLQLASLQETVTVSGASPLVDVTNSNIQTNFTAEMLSNLIDSSR